MKDVSFHIALRPWYSNRVANSMRVDCHYDLFWNVSNLIVDAANDKGLDDVLSFAYSHTAEVLDEGYEG